MKLFKNKWFWIILISIIVLIFIRRNWSKWSFKAKGRFGPQHGDWQPGTITDARKSVLEGLARELYDAIYSGWGATIERGPIFNKVAYLNDNELEYTANYYKSAITKTNSLYYDVDEEYMPYSNSDEELMAKLSAIGVI